jgi:hypothetical protein
LKSVIFSSSWSLYAIRKLTPLKFAVLLISSILRWEDLLASCGCKPFEKKLRSIVSEEPLHQPTSKYGFRTKIRTFLIEIRRITILHPA